MVVVVLIIDLRFFIILFDCFKIEKRIRCTKKFLRSFIKIVIDDNVEY